MKNFRLAVLAALASVFLPAAPAHAQVSTARQPVSTAESSPVVVRQSAPKAMWLKAEVVHADRNSIVVRERDNPRFIHTFSYGPQVKAAMENRADRGKIFQAGENVRIRYMPGQSVALKISGKTTK